MAYADKAVAAAKEKEWRLKNSARLKEYYLQNKERIKARVQAYRASHKSEDRVRHRKRYLANPEKFVARSKAWRANHPDKVREFSKRYSAKHRKEIRLHNQEYYKLHRREILAKSKQNRAKTLKRMQQTVAQRRKIVLEHYGNRCACCGLADTRFLTLDHVPHGKGNPKGKAKKCSRVEYGKCIAAGFPKEYQVLCMNCNWVKGMYGKCFHQTDLEEAALG